MTNILGGHNVAELKDLVAAKDGEVNALGTAYAALQDKSKIDATWLPDYTALRTRYQIARGTAQTLIDNAANAYSGDTSPAEDEYNGVLLALQQNPPNTTKGDSYDLYNRFMLAGGNNPLPYGETQPGYTDLMQLPANPVTQISASVDAQASQANATLANQAAAANATAAASAAKLSQTQDTLLLFGGIFLGAMAVNAIIKSVKKS